MNHYGRQPYEYRKEPPFPIGVFITRSTQKPVDCITYGKNYLVQDSIGFSSILLDDAGRKFGISYLSADHWKVSSFEINNNNVLHLLKGGDELA